MEDAHNDRTPGKSFFVAVHVGAGSILPANEDVYNALMKKACEVGAQKLEQGVRCEDALCAVVAVLEDSPLTNAGFGSNLSNEGTVECDASVMYTCKNRTFPGYGAVGAIPGINNPIKAALSIAKVSKGGMDIYGRVQPETLVGHGAYKWAREHGVPGASSREEMRNCNVTDQSRDIFKKWHKIISENEQTTQGQSLEPEHHGASPTNERQRKRPRPTTPDELDGSSLIRAIETRLDTVGAICLDIHGDVSAAVSSGGFLMKFPGRMGQAASYGSGCWAESYPQESTSGEDRPGSEGSSPSVRTSPSAGGHQPENQEQHTGDAAAAKAQRGPDAPTLQVACSTSGCGETISRLHFARHCCNELAQRWSDMPLSKCEVCSHARQAPVSVNVRTVDAHERSMKLITGKCAKEEEQVKQFFAKQANYVARSMSLAGLMSVNRLSFVCNVCGTKDTSHVTFGWSFSTPAFGVGYNYRAENGNTVSKCFVDRKPPESDFKVGATDLSAKEGTIK